ncbi:hypothetical protein H4R33_001970, partial [Dimargaris cristalligena]
MKVLVFASLAITLAVLQVSAAPLTSNQEGSAKQISTSTSVSEETRQILYRRDGDDDDE